MGIGLHCCQPDADRSRAFTGRVAVSLPSPQLERVFQITNLDKLFTLYPDRTVALQRFSSLQK